MNANLLSLVGRLLMAALFIPAGFGKIAGFEGTVGYIQSVGLPMASLAAALAIVVELGGGILLALGYRTKWVALALAAFTLVAGVFFHNYWAMPAEAQMMQQIMFWKNIAIAGGLLSVAAWGAGAFSLDAKLAKA